MNRRTFLSTLSATLATTAWTAGAPPRAPQIVLRSSWQTVNIGDIAHTPGVLALLEKYLPDAEVRLWPSSVADGVEAILRRRFPKLQFVQSAGEKQAALDECDFFLHGSGASLVAEKDLAHWHEATGKPFGVLGITLSDLDERRKKLLDAARFVYFRDSVSLKLAKERGLACKTMDFGPDGAFACDLRNDDAAEQFMRTNGLEAGKFLCCIPRLRRTPYWLIRHKKMTPEDEQTHAKNEKMKEHDHAALRQAIVEVVRQTKLRVLVCPEDQSQMAVGKEMLVDPLPDDVKARVVWREKYWLTDEALSTYVRSAGLFGNEMHSPIMCVGNGIPAIVCRWAEQTSKGLMWRDIGLGEWLFNLDEEPEIAGIVPAVLAIAKDPAAAKEKALKAREFVRQKQSATMESLKRELPS